MIVVRDLSRLSEPALSALPRPRVFTSGVFDGLHLAHQSMVRRTVAEARAEKGTAGVLTYANHPLSVLAPPYVPKALLSPKQKTRILEEMGIDLLLMPSFTRAFAAMGPEAFVREVLAGILGLDRLVVGYDFRFGKRGEGDTALLEQLASECGFELEVVAAIYDDGVPVSSTQVRELIDTGRVHIAMEKLGRPYEIGGPVVHGYGRGGTLGFPTANIEFDPAFAIPPSGVYAVLVDVSGRLYKGMMNIGASPTFAGNKYRSEAFLLDFGEDGDEASHDLYDQTVRVLFIDRLREERKFESVHALQERLHVDETMARAILETYLADKGA
jgi:riboflavin kinase / FMN adenylyltransferase